MIDCPLPAIGVVRTPYLSREDTPVQSSLNREVEGVLELDADYAEGLDGLSGFDYAWLLTWLGAGDSEAVELHQVPFLLRPEGHQVGLFAMRGPRRPNPIGLSLVRLVGFDGPRVTFAGVDMVDGTPVLDLKPYVAQFDRPPVHDVRSGWFDTAALPPGATPKLLYPDRIDRH